VLVLELVEKRVVFIFGEGGLLGSGFHRVITIYRVIDIK
jgi:hypothetical protein